VISSVGDEPFISTATSIAPRIINNDNSQISLFMVLIDGSSPKRLQDSKHSGKSFHIRHLQNVGDEKERVRKQLD